MPVSNQTAGRHLPNMFYKAARYVKNIFNDCSKAVFLFLDHFCYLCLVSVVLSCLFIAALWSRAVKGLTALLSCV